MRAHDFLIEGATDVLYHKTSTRAAANILKDGVFKLASSVGTQAEEQYAPPGRPYFLSTSRSKAGDYARWVGSSEVMFNLNGQWLAQRYKVKPIDYWERAWQHSPERTSEGEDRVFSKDPEISIECVTAVHAFIKSADEWRSPYTRQVLLVAKQRGIPAYLYTDPQAWKLQDTRKAVSPQQAAALLKGSTPVRTQYKPASSYLEPWLELIYKKAKSELSPAAEKLRHNLVYYGLRYPNEDSGLASDMNNSRKPDSPDYANVDKLIKFMRANRLAKPADLKNALAQKWDAINTKEQQSAKGQQGVAEDKSKRAISISKSVDGGSLEGYVVDSSSPQLTNYLHSQAASDNVIDQIKSQFTRIAILRNLSVDEDMRGQGIGNDLVSDAIDNSVYNGAEAIVLVSDTGEDNAFDLTKWYEGFGFEIYGSAAGDPIMILDLTIGFNNESP